MTDVWTTRFALIDPNTTTFPRVMEDVRYGSLLDAKLGAYTRANRVAQLGDGHKYHMWVIGPDGEVELEILNHTYGRLPIPTA